MFAGWNKKEKEDDIVYLCINAHWETQYVRLPELPIYLEWRIAVNTAMPFGEDISDSINEMLQVGDTLEIEPRSVMILIGISKI